ncbi:MAG: SgcJ/EcaC family oxidoreductase [Hydrococcus sp. C42_A2020_068]|nr:SgcJ/EcaC family oxidoreductase [Hydrococcus sp. C42_A2020_068]
MSDRQAGNLVRLILRILIVVVVVAATLNFTSYSALENFTPAAIANSLNRERAESMQPEEIRATIEQAREAWVKGDAEAFASLFSPDGEFIVPGNRWVGREAIRQVAADFFASHSSVRIDIKQIIIEGDRAAVEWYWEEKNQEGRLNRADDAILVDFQAGQIVRFREYIDTATWGGQDNL